MKKLFASVLCVVVAVSLSPTLSAAGRPMSRLTAQPTQDIGEIAGTSTRNNKPLPNYKVRLRNVDSGELVRDSVTDAGGNFKFTGLPVGNYLVETVDSEGNIIATSAMLIGNLGVGSSAAVAGGVAAGGGGALLGTTTIVTLTAVAAGVTAAVVATTNDASASGG